MATVAAIGAGKGAISITLDDGTTQRLDFRRVASRHVRSGWVGTIHSARVPPPSASWPIVEAFRAKTVDARSVYAAISRARSGAALYTDSRGRSPMSWASATMPGRQSEETWARDWEGVTIGL